MREIITVIFLLIVSNISYCQSYGNIWQMGRDVGIDFNSCSPALITGNNSGKEGCSSISDSNGQLLFYTNSDTVWNKMHVTMTNGSLVPSSNGSLSQVIIIPKPASSSIYYVVTTMLQALGNFSMQYHTIDMSLNGGLGAVINKNNILTSLTITEQVSATYHSNGSDIWLMTHEYGTNNFLSFLVNSSGISSIPVISSVGPAHIACISSINSRGEIKFSPDGNKIAFNANGIAENDSTNILAVFDFNKTDGIVSNPIILPFSKGEYGLTFSPDNTKLYGGTQKAYGFTINDYNYLYQFDLTSGIPSTIVNSKFIIDSLQVPTSYGSIKIGPDGKIYLRYVGSNKNYLGVLTKPNLSGALCGFIKDGFYIGNQSYQGGLNHYIEYQTYCSTSDLESIENYSFDLTISPNPLADQVTLKSNIEFNNTLITIRDISGNLIKFFDDLNGKLCTLSCENLQEGLYFLEIHKDNIFIEQKKFIIKR